MTTTTYVSKFQIKRSEHPCYTDGKVYPKFLMDGTGSCVALIEEDHTSPATLRTIKKVAKRSCHGAYTVRFGRKVVFSGSV